MTVPQFLLNPAAVDQTQQPGNSTAAELLWFSSPISYPDAWELQLRLHQERVTDSRPDAILVLEHQPVYTVGRLTRVADWGGDPASLHINGIEIQHVNRGGSITYHGPGQLVVYPILRLTQHVSGVRAYVERLEEAILRCLSQHGMIGHRKENAPGIWMTNPHEAKIASIGIRVDRGVTMHGIALNVDLDLSPFQAITPCGLTGCRITSMADIAGRRMPLPTVTRSLLDQLQQVFRLTWTHSPTPIEFHTQVSS
jgi:lipoyl(octanoyl) transferase